MSEPFLGEIRMFGFAFAPSGWALCDGTVMSASQNASLCHLLGAQFGGNGATTFGLPDLRSRTPMHSDATAGFAQGVSGGYEKVTLDVDHMPVHRHTMRASSEGKGSPSIGSNSVFNSSMEAAYHEPSHRVPMNSGVCTFSGGGEAHNNIQPSLGVGFCIALQGIFPTKI